MIDCDNNVYIPDREDECSVCDDLQEEIDKKQNILTEGDNISIEDDVISSTSDVTYTSNVPSGVHIGTLNVDGETTKLYIPSGSAVNADDVFLVNHGLTPEEMIAHGWASTLGSATTQDEENVAVEQILGNIDDKSNVTDGAFIEPVFDSGWNLYSKANRYYENADNGQYRYDLFSLPLTSDDPIGDQLVNDLIIYTRNVSVSGPVNTAWWGGYASTERNITFPSTDNWAIYQMHASVHRATADSNYLDVVTNMGSDGTCNYRIVSPTSFTNITVTVCFMLVATLSGTDSGYTADTHPYK